MKISVADDFSKTPGFRFITDGPYSGQEFREKLLEPIFDDIKFSGNVEINLDGVPGYATSFLEEAFGELARKYGINRVQKLITFVCEDEPLLIDEIKTYIRDCNEKK